MKGSLKLPFFFSKRGKTITEEEKRLLFGG